MNTCLRAFFFASLGVFLSSCIEFEREEIRYRHDATADQLRITLKYEGIFGGSSAPLAPPDEAKKPRGPKELTDQQKEQLESVLEGGRAFFFSNWIFEYDSSSIRETLEKFKTGELEHGDSPFGKPEKKLLLAALQDVELTNFGLYVDEKGRLCGTQTLVVKRFSNFLDLANKVIRRQVAHGIREQRDKVKPGEAHPESAPSQKTIGLLENACDKGHNFLTMQNGRLVVSVPLADREYLEFKQKVLEKEPNPDDPSDELPEGVSATYRNNVLTLVLGKMTDGVAAMRKKCFADYSANALRYVRDKHSNLLKDEAMIEAASARFLTGGD